MLRRGLAPSRSRSCRCRARECERGDLGGVRCPGACVDAGRPGSRRRDNTTGDRPPASDDRAMIDRSLDHKCPRCRCHFFFEGQVYTIPTTCTTVSRAHGAVTALQVPPYFLPSHFITPGFWISRSTQCMGPWERGSPTSSLDHGIPTAAQPRVEESTLYRTCAAPTVHV